MDAVVQREPMEVLRLRAAVRTRADYPGPAVSESFRALEARLPSIQRRKFYGVSSSGPSGEQYFACVEREAGDDPVRLGLDTGIVAGGSYMRRKIDDWPGVVGRGGLGPVIGEMMRTHPVDPSRPRVEFYRSHRELHLLVPVLGTARED